MGTQVFRIDTLVQDKFLCLLDIRISLKFSQDFTDKMVRYIYVLKLILNEHVETHYSLTYILNDLTHLSVCS